MKLVSSLDELRLEFADAVVDSDGWFATALDLMFAAECLERPPRCPPSRAPTSAARPVPRLFCSGRRGTLPQPARSPIPCLPPLAGHVTDLVIKMPTLCEAPDYVEHSVGRRPLDVLAVLSAVSHST